MTDRGELHRAFVEGDLVRVKAALGDPADFPNSRGDFGVGGDLLEYAIYHSPIAFIRTMLDLGANVDYEDHGGFPALIAAQSTERGDRAAVVELLLDRGADIQARGVNDWTPLHYAAASNDLPMIELLLSRGADPNARTGIDDRATPMEEAELLGKTEAVALLRKLTGG